MANSSSGESVVQRVARILHAFDADHSELTAVDLAARSGLSRSTAHRLAADLETEGLLARTPEGKFMIGLGLWELAQRSSIHRAFVETALPFLEGMHIMLQQNVALSVLDEEDRSVVFLERLRSQRVTTDVARVAERLPALSTSPGLAMLAFSPAEVQERFLIGPIDDAARAAGLTEHRLRRTLAQARQDGYVHLREVLVAHSSGTAAPVLGPGGRVLGALSVVKGIEDINLPAQVPVVLNAARRLSHLMGHRG